MRAVRQRDLFAVRYLLKTGVSPDTRYKGATLLHCTAVNGDRNLIARLLEAGADPDAVVRNNATPGPLQQQGFLLSLTGAEEGPYPLLPSADWTGLRYLYRMARMDEDRINPYEAPASSLQSTPPEGASPSAGTINGTWIAGLVINTLITLLGAAAYGAVLGLILLVFLILCILGTLLYASGVRKAGAALFIIGSIAYVPIGIVGLLGMRKAQDALKAQEFFSQRRNT